MNETHNCPTCGAELPHDSTDELCPKCLLKAGLDASTENVGQRTDGPTLPRASSQAAEDATIAPHGNVDGKLAVGSNVRYFGDYQLLEEIARGGMGVVYKARQTSLNRIVALKMILAGQLASEEDVKRFHAEAEAAAQLDHPGIVPIHEVGEHEGQHYFSMSYVDGGSLADRLKGGPLPPREAAGFVGKTCNAVAYAHQHGVIHRDLKPGNVLLDKTGEPKVTDFGLAKRVRGDSGLTATGQILGTPSYMSPEQAAGKTVDVSKAVDIYALGAVLYALLTGRPPFQADNPIDTLKQVLEQDPISARHLNPKIARDLETICVKCLRKAPSQRYDTANELAQDIRRYLDGKPIHARPIPVTERLYKCTRRHPAAAVAVLLVSTLTLGILGLSLWYNARLEDQMWDSIYAQCVSERLAGNRWRSLELVARAKSMRHSLEEENSLRRAAVESVIRPGARLDHGVTWGGNHSYYYTPNDQFLVASEGDRGSHLRDPKSWAAVDLIGGPYDVLGVSLDSSLVAIWNGSKQEGADLARSQVEILVLDTATGRTVCQFQGLAPVVFSPDNQHVASASSEGIQILSIDNNTEKTLLCLGRPIVFQSPEDLAVTYEEHRVSSWRWTTRTELSATPDYMDICDVSRDGKWVAGCLMTDNSPSDSKGSVVLKHLVEGANELVAVPDAHRPMDDLHFSVRFSPDGSRLAVVDFSSPRINVWNIERKEYEAHFDLSGSNYSLSKRLTFFSEDNSMFAAQWDGGKFRIWDVETGTIIAEIPGTISWGVLDLRTLPGHSTGRTRDIRNNSVTPWSRNGRWLLLGNGYGLQRWEIHDAVPTRRLTKTIRSIQFNVDDAQLTANNVIWDVDSHLGSPRLTYRSILPDEVDFVQFGEPGAAWSVERRNNTVAVTELSPSGLMAEATFNEDVQIVSCALSRQGKLATLARGMVNGLWGEVLHLKNSSAATRWPISMGSARVVEFSADGTSLFIAGQRLQVWDVVEGRLRKEYDPNTMLSCVVDSKDSKLVFFGSQYGTVHVASLDSSAAPGFWDGHDVKEIGEQFGTTAMAYDDSHRLLATGGADGMLKIWDCAALMELPAHEKARDLNHIVRSIAEWSAEQDVTSLTFSRTGELLASGGQDGRVKLWNLKSILAELEQLGFDIGRPGTN